MSSPLEPLLLLASWRGGSPLLHDRSIDDSAPGRALVAPWHATLLDLSPGRARDGLFEGCAAAGRVGGPVPSRPLRLRRRQRATGGWVPAALPPPPPGKPPEEGNVILLSIDSLRADMPWNGYARPIAPRLTELEQKAVTFRNAYSVSSYTSMSLGGLLGGRIPSELVRDGYFFGIYKKDLFFPKLLQKAGVHTMGVMAHMYFKGAGFDSGFDDWRIVPGITFDANTDRDITSPQHEKLAEEMLGDPANDTRRFFFWAHFLDPHDIYQHARRHRLGQ